MSGVTIGGLTEDDLKELGEGLRAGKFRRLKKLNLGGNGITDKGALVLAEALKADCGLQLLDLVDNRITDKGALALAEALHVNSSLQWLELSRNRLTDKGSLALAEALQVNSSLHDMEIVANQKQEELTRECTELWQALQEKTDLESKGRAHIDKLKEKLSAAAAADANAKAQISDLEASIAQKNAAMLTLGKESDTLRTRLSDSSNEQKATKDQLVAANAQLEKLQAAHSELVERETKGRSQAWEAINKVKDKLAVSENGEAAARARISELEASFSVALSEYSNEQDGLRSQLAELKSLQKATKDQLASRMQELERSQALIAEMTDKEARRRAASKDAATKSKEQLAAAAEVELASQGRIHELESKLSSTKATAAGVSKELEAFKTRLAESLSAQKDLKEQLLHTSSELERTHTNLAEITEKESMGRSQAWDALNKLKEKLLTSVQNESSMRGRMIELESSSSATAGSLLAAGKQNEILNIRATDLESACKTLRSQLASSKSELQHVQACLSELTEKETKGRQSAKETIEQLNEKLESITFAKSAAHSTATKEADVLKARVADLESSCRTLREQLSSSQSELERTQASLVDMTDKELKGRQSAKDVTEKLREKLSIAAEAELGMKARISELEDALKAKSMSLVASHKDVDSLKARLADAEAAHKSMSDQFLQCSVDLERSQAASRACGKRLSSTAFDLESSRSSLSDMTERAHSLQESIEKLKIKLTTTQNGEASAQHRVAELEQTLAGKGNSLMLATKECETLRNLLAEAESAGRMLKARCENLESDKQKLNASLIVGAEKEALMAARGRESTEQLQEMLKSSAKAQDETRRHQSLAEASASDYAHKCEVLAASLRDSQAHCRDLEKQIESALSKVAQGHETSRRLQDELVTKAVEISTEQYQSRDLRSQIESLAEEHKRQAEAGNRILSKVTDDLRVEKDRRGRLEEALRSARVCVRCGHPRVFITELNAAATQTTCFIWSIANLQNESVLQIGIEEANDTRDFG